MAKKIENLRTWAATRKMRFGPPINSKTGPVPPSPDALQQQNETVATSENACENQPPPTSSPSQLSIIPPSSLVLQVNDVSNNVERNVRSASPPPAAFATTISASRPKPEWSSSSSGKPKKLRLASSLQHQHAYKFVVHLVQGDGNCLFRSVSLQVYGDETWHDRVREECLEFMAKDRDHFINFIDGDFGEYIAAKRRNGCFGDNPEIQAMAELYNRPVIVLTDSEVGDSYKTEEEEDDGDCVIQINSIPRRFKRMNIFHNKYAGEEENGAAPIRLLYRAGNHYDAVIDPYAATVGVGLGFANFEPGKVERDMLQTASWTADVEATEKELEKAALAASLEEAFGKKPPRANLPTTTASSKKRRRGLFSPRGTLETTSRSGSASASPAVGDLTHKESADYPMTITSAMRELLLNGFNLEQVMTAYSIVGDSFDDMLALLLSTPDS